MESVIPCLLQSLHKRNDSLYGDLSELLLSFAAAFVHIPSRRRLDLFVSLVNKLGPYDNLFALLTVLMDKYPNESLVIKFAADLAGHYDVKTRLRVGSPSRNLFGGSS